MARTFTSLFSASLWHLINESRMFPNSRMLITYTCNLCLLFLQLYRKNTSTLPITQWMTQDRHITFICMCKYTHISFLTHAHIHTDPHPALFWCLVTLNTLTIRDKLQLPSREGNDSFMFWGVLHGWIHFMISWHLNRLNFPVNVNVLCKSQYKGWQGFFT